MSVETTTRKKSFNDIAPRFRTARRTLLIDRFMTRFIKCGGIGIVAAVMAIFVFIFCQTLPLFQGATVTEDKVIDLQDQAYAVFGADEWGELPFAADLTGRISFIDKETGTVVETLHPADELGKAVSAVTYDAKHMTLVYGAGDGTVFMSHIAYKAIFSGDSRRIKASVETDDPLEIGVAGFPFISLDYSDTDEKKLIGAIQETDSGRQVFAATLVQEQTLFGGGEVEVDAIQELTDQIIGTPEKVLCNASADGILVSTLQGEVYYFFRNGESFERRQIFAPFENFSSNTIASMDYLFGDVSLVLTHESGANRIYSLYIPEASRTRIFSLTKEFPDLPGPADFYSESLRNKSFLIGAGDFVSIRQATTGVVRWEQRMPYQIKAGFLGRKYDSIFLIDQDNRMYIYRLDDPHPEAGFKAYFGKLWYEGYPGPQYVWQSTGGADDFEPKLSLIPLIIGTLKGTFFAMLFALPIAVLAAVYTSQFAHPRFRATVKPTMEIMASLPSVVLGFLAALWLAPLIETQVPSLIVISALIPLGAMAFGALWNHMPFEYRRHVKAGYEWIVLIPVLLLIIQIGWMLGPVLEKIFFVVTDPASGERVADFRLWWPAVTGTAFEQRNSLVVGFMMGFAVIPIIFTISEDALSNVPKALLSGSLALGASRWQTALRVILPTAFPGIFSALMIGLGRAVGETMIVVMATGNTPIMDFNIFSGMRTLSANIAVELPEAPYLGTLYRTLFLGALVLFLMTFVLNTFAELIRQHLREKYKVV